MKFYSVVAIRLSNNFRRKNGKQSHKIDGVPTIWCWQTEKQINDVLGWKTVVPFGWKYRFNFRKWKFKHFPYWFYSKI